MPKLKVAMVANDLPPTPDWVVPELAKHEIELLERECVQPSEVVATAARIPRSFPGGNRDEIQGIFQDFSDPARATRRRAPERT